MKKYRSWFWKLYMRWSYIKSPHSTVKARHDQWDSFPEFIKQARLDGRVANDNYKSDRLFGAINRIKPPDVALSELKAEEFGETYDCDDFASAMIGSGDQFDPYLFTYFTRGVVKSHTIPLYLQYDGYWVVDWITAFGTSSFEQLIEVLEDYHKVTITAVEVAKFNYSLGRYVKVKTEEVFA